MPKRQKAAGSGQERTTDVGSRKRPRGAEESDEAKLARVEPHYEQAQQHALELASGDLSDVTLRVGAAGAKRTTDIPFNRYPLATQSPVFSGMLLSGMSESQGDAVVRVEYALQIVQQMLAYVASAAQAFEPDTCMELHQCADFYQITGLQTATAEYVAASLDDKTAVTFLNSAVANGLEELAEKCREYVERHASKALAGELVCKLSQDAFVGLLNSEALNMREIEVFEAVVRWGKSGKQSNAALKAKVAPLMEGGVRFGLMSGEELAETVMPSELVDLAITADAVSAAFKKVKPTGIRHRPRARLAPPGPPHAQLSVRAVTPKGGAARALAGFRQVQPAARRQLASTRRPGTGGARATNRERSCSTSRAPHPVGRVGETIPRIEGWKLHWATMVIKGTVYDYPGHADGAPISTSHVQSSEGSVIWTNTGSRYRLGSIDAAFAQSIIPMGPRPVSYFVTAEEPLQGLLDVAR